MIQIIEIKGIDPPLTPVAFDSTGKGASKDYYNAIIQDLSRIGVVYRNDNFNKQDRCTVEEVFYKLVNGTLVPAANFEDCDFYECNFFTGDIDGNDLGIVSFCYYTVINAGCQVNPCKQVFV